MQLVPLMRVKLCRLRLRFDKRMNVNERELLESFDVALAGDMSRVLDIDRKRVVIEEIKSEVRLDADT